MTATAAAYGIDEALKTEEYGNVTLPEAVAIFDKRMGGLRASYDWVEQALHETMFGFSRSNGEFVELCIHAQHHVSCAIELPSLRPTWWQQLLGSTGRIEFDLNGRAEAIDVVTDFFTLSEAAFAAKLAARRA